MVDPATGAVRTTTLAPAGDRTDAESGRSTMAPGSSTLYLFLTVQSGDGIREELFAVDAASGQVLADRDLADDVAAASQYPVGRQLAGLVARPDGGATLVFDASPTEVAEDRIPTLLTYDAALEPVGGPVRATGLAEGAETQSVAGAADGTVFLHGRGAGRRVAARASRTAAAPDRCWPSWRTASTPTRWWSSPRRCGRSCPRRRGPSRSTSPPGSCAGRSAVDCTPKLDVRALYPASTGALMIGECDTPREDTQMLWFLGPEG